MHVHGQVLAAAERAAHAGQDQPDLLRRQAERGADLLLVHMQPLGGNEKLHASGAVRHGQSRLGAEERLVLHPDLVAAGHDHVGRGRRVALADLQMADQVAARMQPRRARLERGDGIGDRLEHLVVHDDLARGEPGHLGVIGGDQRDRLARVAAPGRRRAPAGRRCSSP